MSAQKTRFGWRNPRVLAAGFLVAGCAAVLLGMQAPAGTPDAAAITAHWESGLFTVEHGGFRYSFQAVSGAEALHDLAVDPRCRTNLARERADLVARLRGDLERSLGKTLGELRAPHADTTRRLEALGYL